MLCVNEPGLYRLVFRARKEKAELFKTWVFEKAIPQIRKTRSYLSEKMREKIEGLEKSLMIAQSSQNTYKSLWEQERRTIKRYENRNFLTLNDKKEIISLYINKYPVSAIQRITKKGKTRIKNFINEVLAMDDAAMEAMFDEWKKTSSRDKEAV